MNEPRVLREDDPDVPALVTAGWQVAHRSWGARLAGADRAALHAIVAHAERQGYDLREVGQEADGAIAALEEITRADYPGGPATAPAEHTGEALAGLRAGGTRCFAAFAGTDLVAVTAIRAEGEHAETDFTSVERAHRRRGLAEAVKAASVLALDDEGVRVFGTGGAEENAASLAMNARLGYVVTERWLTLASPPSLVL